jgi:hypothetical protein
MLRPFLKTVVTRAFQSAASDGCGFYLEDVVRRRRTMYLIGAVALVAIAALTHWMVGGNLHHMLASIHGH